MFEKITKNVNLSSDFIIENLDYNSKIGNIETVATCCVGFNIRNTYEEAKANAEFITFCFNLQQRFDIGLFQQVILKLSECNRRMQADGYPNHSVDALLNKVYRI